MKIKLLIISAFIPILIWGQNSNSPQFISTTYQYDYDKGVLSLIIKKSSNSDVYIQNENERNPEGSAIVVEFLDVNDKVKYNGRWSLGPKSYVIIPSDKLSHKVDYAIDKINTNQRVTKKIVLDVDIKYTVITGDSREFYFYKETKEIPVN